MSVKCAKQTVIAIVVNNGEYWVGSNWCKTPQAVCPRGDMKTGEGYELCKSVCHQENHAEINALNKAGSNANGGELYIIGHSYCCDTCKNIATERGIKKIHIYEK